MSRIGGQTVSAAILPRVSLVRRCVRASVVQMESLGLVFPRPGLRRAPLAVPVPRRVTLVAKTLGQDTETRRPS